MPPFQTSEGLVVLQPRVSEEVRGPLAVRGYSRISEPRIEVALVGLAGEVIASETVPADNGTNAWSEYEATLEFSGYEGVATLRVAGEGAREGPDEGAELDVIVEESPGRGDR
jgi:hypothetical protein